MRLVLIFNCLFILICSSNVEAQQSDNSTSIERLLPIETKDDFKAGVQLFQELINNPKTHYYYWDASFLELFEQARKWAVDNESSQGLMQAEFMLLMYYDNRLENDSVIKKSEKLITEPNFENQKKSAYTYLALYYAYERKGFYRRQLDILDKLIFLNEKFNYPVRPKTYSSAFDLANIYYNLEQYDLSRINYKKQKKIFKNLKMNFVKPACSTILR